MAMVAAAATAAAATAAPPAWGTAGTPSRAQRAEADASTWTYGLARRSLFSFHVAVGVVLATPLPVFKDPTL